MQLVFGVSTVQMEKKVSLELSSSFLMSTFLKLFRDIYSRWHVNIVTQRALLPGETQKEFDGNIATELTTYRGIQAENPRGVFNYTKEVKVSSPFKP